MGCCGLQVYKFGEIVSIPFFTEKWRPYSFYAKIKGNAERGLHTLALLDIKVKEPTLESLARGKPVYMAPRYMSTKVAAQQLLEAAEKEDLSPCYNENTKCFGLARIATQTQLIVAGTLKQFATEIDMGEPLHSLVLCGGELHEIESEMYNHFLFKPC